MAPVRVITLTADGRDELYERCVVCGVRRPRDRHLVRLFAYSMTHCHRILCPFRFQRARFARGSSASRRNCNFKLDLPEYSLALGSSPGSVVEQNQRNRKRYAIYSYIFPRKSFKSPENAFYPYFCGEFCGTGSVWLGQCRFEIRDEKALSNIEKYCNIFFVYFGKIHLLL